MTPKLRLDETSLSSNLLRSKCFHLICTPSRCMSLATNILERRRKECPTIAPPILIWEPVPDACVPEELDNAQKAAQMVDIVSPNHEELRIFFDSGRWAHRALSLTNNDQLDRAATESLCNDFNQRFGDGRGVRKVSLVVRCGKYGCYIHSPGNNKWLPAFHDSATGKVIDPTGGGNTFLGGLGVGLARGQDLEEAAAWASVAASFAIEQVGVPSLTNNGTEERWNNVVVSQRLEEYDTKSASEKRFLVLQ